MAKILVVEDDEAMNDVLVRSLAGLGHESCSALNSAQAMELAISHTFSLIITDVILPGQDGIECLTMIRSLQPNVRCIVITGYARKEIPAQAVEQRISDYLVKPFTLEQFLTEVNWPDNSAEYYLDQPPRVKRSSHYPGDVKMRSAPSTSEFVPGFCPESPP